MTNENKIQIDEIEGSNLAFTLQKTDRILAENEALSVQDSESVTSSGGLAFSLVKDAKIYLNFKDISSFTCVKNSFDYLVFAKGLNYHELAHILFTDYSVAKIKAFLGSRTLPFKANNKNYVSAVQFKEILNMLEDNRIENLFHSQYPNVKNYFTFCAYNLLLKNATSIKNWGDALQNYIIIFGRKYLSDYQNEIAEIRNYLSTFKQIKEVTIQKCERIADAYCIEEDLNKRFELALELYNLFYNNKDNTDDKTPYPKQTSNSTSLEGKNQSKTTIKIAVRKFKEEQKKKEEEKKASASSSSNNQEQKSQEQEKELKDIAQEVNNDESVQQEIENDTQSILSAQKQGKEYSGDVFEATTQHTIEQHKLHRVLKTLRSDLSSNVVSNQTRGDINIQSVMKSLHNGSMKIFEQKQLNRIDKSKLAVSFILDASGSVSKTAFKTEISSVYCLTKALEQLKNKVEVIEFSNTYRQLKSFNNEGDWKRTLEDDTRILHPLLLSQKNLLNLKKKENIQNLFTIIITDGGFNDTNVCDELPKRLDELKRNGIKVLWILVNTYLNFETNKTLAEWKKHFDYTIQINNFTELSAELSKIIKSIQKDITKKIKNGHQFYN